MTKTMVQRTKRANKNSSLFGFKRSEFKAYFQGFHCFSFIHGREGIMLIIPLSLPDDQNKILKLKKSKLIVINENNMRYVCTTEGLASCSQSLKIKWS